MNTFVIKSVRFGEGRPKLCVPLCAADTDRLMEALAAARKGSFDLVEWRADYFRDAGDTDAVLKALAALRRALPDKPILFTFRTEGEGGVCAMPEDAYGYLAMRAAETGLADLVDLELAAGARQRDAVLRAAHEAGARVILSHHNFTRTYPAEEIVEILTTMSHTNADAVKIALMPKTRADVLALMSAAVAMREVRPLIAISMGTLGQITRICAEFIGSILTFGAAGLGSAPGQLDAAALYSLLEQLHAAG